MSLINEIRTLRLLRISLTLLIKIKIPSNYSCIRLL